MDKPALPPLTPRMRATLRSAAERRRTKYSVGGGVKSRPSDIPAPITLRRADYEKGRAK